MKHSTEKQERRKERHKYKIQRGLGFKFHGQYIKKHGIRFAWSRLYINSRQGICLICKLRSDKCTCKIEIIKNQIHF